MPPKRITKNALAPPLASEYEKISFFRVFCSMATRSGGSRLRGYFAACGEVCEPDPANWAATAANCEGSVLSAAAAWSAIAWLGTWIRLSVAEVAVGRYCW